MDMNLYNYEYATALLLRILQLSMPNESLAMFFSLLGGLGEVMVRILFFTIYQRGGMKNLASMSYEDRMEYAWWGKRRVMDGSNDMLVEYMSSVMATLFLLYLSPTDAFTFASSDEVDRESVLFLCGIQIIPEIFLDLFCTFIEIFGGLSKIHKNYWTFGAGGDPNNKHLSNRIGDMPKALAMKISTTTFLSAFVLTLCLK